MPRDDTLIRIDNDARTPPFEQIFEQIRALIERGSLAPGSPLPTVRKLAGDLSVAPNTVARAYADLKAHGWVVGEERKLARVARSAPTAAKSDRRKALVEAIDAFLASLRGRGYARDEIEREVARRIKVARLP
jgi:DNA-binding transcriptional regulator YhcF (GntR family)